MGAYILFCQTTQNVQESAQLENKNKNPPGKLYFFKKVFENLKTIFWGGYQTILPYYLIWSFLFHMSPRPPFLLARHGSAGTNATTAMLWLDIDQPYYVSSLCNPYVT